MNKEKILGIITIIIFGVFIYALFFITPEFKVTFNENNGSDAVSYYTVKRGKTVSKPKDPSKDGYTFKYWSYKGEEFNFDTKISKNITLDANYDEIEVPTTTKKKKK